MSFKYSIEVECFAERHFIKKFQKKYKNAWGITWQAIVEELKRIDSLLDTSIAETIVGTDDKNLTKAFARFNIRIIKTEFRIAGTKQSRHRSGNRCIIAVHQDTKMVYVLLVFHKNDLGKGNETEKWKQIIQKNYRRYKDLV